MRAASRTASTRSIKPRRSCPRAGPSSFQTPVTKGWRQANPFSPRRPREKPASAAGNHGGHNDGQQLASRRAAAAAGLGAVGLATAACSEQKGATSKATETLCRRATDAISESSCPFRRRARRPEDPARHDPLANKETVGDWSQGVPLEKMKAVRRLLGNTYDMRRLEQRLNAAPAIPHADRRAGIHFLHVRSKHSNALPIIMTHGWPGSVVEFLKVLGR